jgi:hypothetical protein
VLLAIVLAGIVLRTVQYLADTSLWLDEIALVKGILEFNLTDLLTRSLPYDQVAPKGFLATQKAAVLAFGPTDDALRFVPFASSVIALVAFARFATRALMPVAACVATLLLATAAPLVAFAGTAKQYSSDVCTAVVLSSIALVLVSGPVTARQAWLAAMAGAVLLWFSFPSVFVVVGLTVPVALWMSTTPLEARPRRVAVVAGVWAASALMVTIWSFATLSPETRDYMRVYWADGLAPVSLADWMRTGWPWPRIHRLFRGGFGAQAGLGYPLAPVYVVLAMVGFVLLWRRDRRVALVLLMPMAVTFTAAAVRQYPFSDRMILFLLPAIFAAIAELSAAAVRRAPSTRIAALVVAAISVPAVLPVATRLPPYRVEDLKYVMEHVQDRHLRGDAIYVYYGAAPVMTLYARELGFSPEMYAVGGCHRGQTRRYFEELDTFRGRSRVWLILTHSQPVYREREDILAYLDSIGTRLDSIDRPSRVVGHNPFAAEGFLYDLSSTARLGGADSATFAVTGLGVTNQQNTCVDGPQVMIPSDFACADSPYSRCHRTAESSH